MTSSVLLRRTLLLPVLCVALAACSDDNDGGSGPGAGSFTLGTPASTAVTLAAGQATTVSIPVTFTGAMVPVTLRADSVPAGVHVGFQPSVITSGTEVVTVSVSVDPGTPAMSNKTVKIVAKAEGMTDQVARIAVTTTASSTYSISSPASTTAGAVKIQRTQSGTVTVNIDRSGGFTGPVDIIADALPTGITIVPVSNVTGNTATITINTAANAVAAPGSFTLRAINPTMADRTVTIRYEVLAEPGVQVALAGRTAVASSPDTMFVTVNREGGFTGAVTVTLSGLPAGVTAEPVTSASGSTVAVPLDITDAAAVGAKTVTASVSGTGIATKTATGTLTILNNLLTSGTAITVADARARNSYNVYRVVVPAGATKLDVTFTGGTGDGDIELYDAAFNLKDGSYNADNAEAISLATPAPGTYYIVIWVWNPYANASLKATVTGGTAAALFRAAPAPATRMPVLAAPTRHGAQR